MAKKTVRQALDNIIKEFEHIEKELQALIKKAAKKDLKLLRAKIKKVKGVKTTAILLCRTKTFS